MNTEIAYSMGLYRAVLSYLKFGIIGDLHLPHFLLDRIRTRLCCLLKKSEPRASHICKQSPMIKRKIRRVMPCPLKGKVARPSTSMGFCLPTNFSKTCPTRLRSFLLRSHLTNSVGNPSFFYSRILYRIMCTRTRLIIRDQ